MARDIPDDLDGRRNRQYDRVVMWCLAGNCVERLNAEILDDGRRFAVH
jgi:hypothetical protein